MSTTEQMLDGLVGNGVLSREQFDEATRHAQEQDIPLDQSLVALSLLDYAAMGETMAEIASLPYAAVLEKVSPYDARQYISYAFALHWGTLPVSFDKETDVLTLAVHDAAQTQLIAETFAFFMEPQHLAFSIATEAEIRAAFLKHFGTGDAAARKWRLRPLFTGSQAGRHRTPARENVYSVSPMGRAVISVAACLTTRNLASDPAALNEARERVRYCQLLAVRLGLSSTRTEALVLAAWLAAYEDARELAQQLDTSYPIADILTREADATEHETESGILELVNVYQQCRRLETSTPLDMTVLRQRIQAIWRAPVAEEPILESFLQILVDEEFLTRQESGRGRILLVDQADVSEPILSQPLRNHGYEVVLAPSAAAAREELTGDPVDVALVSQQLPDGDGIQLCRHLKRSPATSDVPVFILAERTDDRTTTDALRAGAEDVFHKPPNIEVLFLRIERLLAFSEDPRDVEGIQGTMQDMSFSDLVQILGAGGKRMVVTFARGADAGHLWIDGGDIVGAQLGELSNEEAFYALMQWSEGDFAAHQCAEFSGEQMRTSVMSLLMEGARRHDEGLL